MTTKERIVDEALSLFSVNGYKGTSVKRIADAVGIKDSSLYKHFKSKQEILDTIVDTMRQHIEDISCEFGLPADDNIEEAAAVYAAFDEKMLVELSNKIFLFYLNDSFVSRFWRMGTIEQFQNPEVYGVFKKLFLEDSIAYQTTLFAELSRQDIFIQADPQVMAVYFYTPIFFLLNKYASDVEHEEEALEILDKQVREFYRIYRRKGV
ncbi:MAG: TetR/AcrR family transcriptional regulator [Lachnospiraceae bacterium]|jgi:AcrR family transcriptional regulator|nr:TetR/AcrR family transcriptional regulator [Lachnospiraceae bacterium]